MHPLYIKSISTLPILFVLFPFRWGNVFLLQCTLHSKHELELNYMSVWTNKLDHGFKVKRFTPLFIYFLSLFVLVLI